GAGGWYIGGAFTRVGDVSILRLAHILADGTVNPDFRPEPDLFVYALALDGARLYVGGNFSNIGGRERARIAAVSTTDGAAIAGWSATVSGEVRALVVSGLRVYVGGQFTTVNGELRFRVAALTTR